MSKFEWRHHYMMPLSSQASFLFWLWIQCARDLGIRIKKRSWELLWPQMYSLAGSSNFYNYNNFYVSKIFVNQWASTCWCWWRILITRPPGKSKGKKIHFCEWNHFNQAIKLALMFHLPWCQLSHPLIIHSAVKDRDVNQIKYLDVGPQAQLPPPTLRTLVLCWPLSF